MTETWIRFWSYLLGRFIGWLGTRIAQRTFA